MKWSGLHSYMNGAPILIKSSSNEHYEACTSILLISWYHECCPRSGCFNRCNQWSITFVKADRKVICTQPWLWFGPTLNYILLHLYTMCSLVQDDPELLGDGGETPKFQGRGWWFSGCEISSWLDRLLVRWSTASCALVLACRSSVSQK